MAEKLVETLDEHFVIEQLLKYNEQGEATGAKLLASEVCEYVGEDSVVSALVEHSIDSLIANSGAERVLDKLLEDHAEMVADKLIKDHDKVVARKFKGDLLLKSK